MKRIAILGAGGFIGSHLAQRLNEQGHEVIGVDLIRNGFIPFAGHRFEEFDLRDQQKVREFFQESFDEVYQLAADMGGAGYIFTGEHDADIMHNSAQINLNVVDCLKNTSTTIFFSSSACIYPEENQLDPLNPNCEESSAFPANPDSEYGWEKLFSERLYLSYARNYGMDVRIARFHNVFGPQCEFDGGREKAPAAIARKVAMAPDGGSIDIWGSGHQTRSFLFIDECLDGIERLMNSDLQEPVNIGSDEMISINDLATLMIGFSGKHISIRNIDGPVGVNGRCSDNRLILKNLQWAPSMPLQNGMKKLYEWVSSQV